MRKARTSCASDDRQGTGKGGFLPRLLSDRSGNTMAIVAAAVAPMLALVGGAIDMGRSYLAESRLQQACDAGVLAARKRLGSMVVVDGAVPSNVADTGHRFFDINFKDGAYGTESRNFAMTLHEDYSISGIASVDVPTTIMQIFGKEEVAIEVDCEARLNFSNTDVMMVLDTTGSMNETNPGDSGSRIAMLREVVKSFHAQLEGAKSPGTRIRYGFVPYSTNVNVGWLLKSGWMVDNWTYHGREPFETGATETYSTYSHSYSNHSGTATGITPYIAASCPPSTASWNTTNVVNTDANGSQTGTTSVHGTSYWCSANDGNTVTVNGTQYNNYSYDWARTYTGEQTQQVYFWQYKTIDVDVRSLKGASADAPMAGGSISRRMAGHPSPEPAWLTAWFTGCIEERSTYEITDYGNVDLTRALDLDLDLVPSPGNPDTQWRPMLHEFSFEREIWWNGSGTFRKTPVTTRNDYMIAAWAGQSTCPSPSQKLQPMTAAQVASYVDGLSVGGNTYHDIGMIWGGRLISSTGLFAGENGDIDGKPTSRHLIFLTDGHTAPRDIAYGTYGIEPLDERRWSQSSSQSLTQVVEGRFGVACSEVKKRNVTVWVIGFGTDMSDMMKTCAGDGHWFQADDAAELSETFSKIAKAMGELRISK